MASVFMCSDEEWELKKDIPRGQQTQSVIEDICRVCRGPSQPGKYLYHPCLCTGSIKYIHQECLVQWLKHSGKRVCELCHHEFQFTPVYRPDMPQHLSVLEFTGGILKSFTKAICRWLHLCFVAMMWLVLVPILIYRLYKFLMYDSLWSLKEIHLLMLTTNNIILDCIYGIIIVLLSLITFVSVVWLKDQLGQGVGRNWFDQDREQRNVGENELVNMQDMVQLPNQNEGNRISRSAVQNDAVPVQQPIVAPVYLQSQLDLLSEEQWKLRNNSWKDFFKVDIDKMHQLNSGILEYRDLLVLSRTIELEIEHGFDRKLDDEEEYMIHIFDSPAEGKDEQSTFHLYQDLMKDRQNRSIIIERADQNCQWICKLLSIFSDSTDFTKLLQSPNLLSDSEKNIILQIRKLKKHLKYSKSIPIGAHQVENRHEPLNLNEGEHQNVLRPNHRHPHIGHAIAGLAREGDLEDVEDLTWARLLGLDGTFRFLEHIFWLLCLNSLLIFVFVYLPYQLGYIASYFFPIFSSWKSSSFGTSKLIIFGYIILSLSLVVLYYFAGYLKVTKIKRILATVIITLKVGVILVIEAGVFPLICGWWIDMCSFGLFNSSLSLRQKSLLHSSGAVMFLHWLAGIIFIFYLASFVVLLREVLRPGVLWFLRNLDDQNFHPINEMINLPIQRHIRRFFMSCVLFGVCIFVTLLLPTVTIKLCMPSFLPLKFSMSSSSPYPIREIYIELILLQFIIPSLIEHGNFQAFIKGIVRAWAKLAARVFGLQSYLLDQAQTGGIVVDVYGEVLREVHLNYHQNGPVHNQIQHLGAGFPPFKPYLRPRYFFLRICMLLLFTLLVVIFLGTLLIVLPVSVGRCVLQLVGISNASEVYSAAIGVYIFWILARVVMFVIPHARGGIVTLVSKVPSWLLITTKCIVAISLLFILIPLCMGLLADMLVISTIRVPWYKTPLYYYSTEWALGLLHTKCACGIIWMSNFNIKATLDQIYNAGVRNMDLKYITVKLAWPILSILSIILLLPYVIFIGFVHQVFGVLSYSSSIICYRYSFPVCFAGFLGVFILYGFILQLKKLYIHVKNQRYLIGQELLNYGSSDL